MFRLVNESCVCKGFSAVGSYVSEEMVDSFYVTQMLPEDKILVSLLSATPEGSKTQITKVCAKTKMTVEV